MSGVEIASSILLVLAAGAMFGLILTLAGWLAGLVVRIFCGR